MHAKAIEIAWHDDSPIWSVDISPANRVVTASGDKVARIWRMSLTNPQNPSVQWLCDLRAHATTINVARFSPDGLSVATAADHGEIVIWRLQPNAPAPSPLALAEADAPNERWQCHFTLRAHLHDVLDLSWSADGNRLASASVDNAVMIWDLTVPHKTPIALRHHANFVQGVSIDPFGRLIASMGSDRALRIFTANSASWFQVSSASSLSADSKLFVDDSRFKSVFRRLAWSPDGSILACPSGLHLPKQPKRLYAVHIFVRNHWTIPVLQCGGLSTPPCAVRFNPRLYRLRLSQPEQRRAQPLQEKQLSKESPASTSTQPDQLPPFHSFTYRMIFAVACAHTILFYDTEQITRPFATVEGLHCAEHTDLSWSSDGLTLLVSAVDGYVSTISLTPEEIGVPLSDEEIPPWLRQNEELIIPRESPLKIRKSPSSTDAKLNLSENVAPAVINVTPRRDIPRKSVVSAVDRKRSLDVNPGAVPSPKESPMKRPNIVRPEPLKSRVPLKPDKMHKAEENVQGNTVPIVQEKDSRKVSENPIIAGKPSEPALPPTTLPSLSVVDVPITGPAVNGKDQNNAMPAVATITKDVKETTLTETMIVDEKATQLTTSNSSDVEMKEVDFQVPSVDVDAKKSSGAQDVVMVDNVGKSSSLGKTKTSDIEQPSDSLNGELGTPSKMKSPSMSPSKKGGMTPSSSSKRKNKGGGKVQTKFFFPKSRQAPVVAIANLTEPEDKASQASAQSPAPHSHVNGVSPQKAGSSQELAKPSSEHVIE